jgi:hypothetical protein
MFRVKHVEKKYINKTFRFPASLMQKLEKTADENDVSVNELMRQCAEYALGDMEHGEDGKL